jgi:hypothetical protein
MTPPNRFRDDQYSYVLNLWLQQLPDGSEVLMQRLSVRRWLSRPFIENDTLFLGKQAVSVYWQRTTGYLSQTPLSRAVYSRLMFKRLRHSIDALRWVGLQSKTLNDLNLGDRLPPLPDLLSDPKAFQADLHIVKSQRDHTAHAIEMGVWANDHREIYHAVSACIAEFAKPHTPAQRAEQKRGFSKLSLSAKKKKEVNSQDRYAALCALADAIGIELYTDDYITAQRVILEEVGALAENKDRLGENPLCVMDGNRLLLQIEHVNVRLDIPLDVTNWKEHDRAIRNRRKEIKSALKPPTIATCALVSIRDYRKKHNLIDPYEAIRWGLADTNRTSQFILKGEKGYTVRLQNSVRDLLRTLGYRYNPIFDSLKGLRSQ